MVRMPALNICFILDADTLKPVIPDDIRPGFKAVYPTLLGGFVGCTCTARNSVAAEFKATDPSYPLCLPIIFEHPDLTFDQFQNLSVALDHFPSQLSDQDAELIQLAHALGYLALVQNHIFYWTEVGEKTRDRCYKTEGKQTLGGPS